MPMVRAMRLLNSIEAGSTSSAQLQQYLTNGGIYSDFSSVVQLPGQCTVLAASNTATAAINSSSSATTIVGSSPYANYAYANNPTAKSLLISTYRTLLGTFLTNFPGTWVPLFTFTPVNTNNFTSNVITRSSSSSWISIAYAGGYFVAVSNNGVTSYSTDGLNWTAGGTIPTYSWGLAGGTIGATTYFVVTYGANVNSPSQTNQVYYSSNHGVNWAAASMPSGDYWSGVAFANNAFIAVAGAESGSSTATAVSTNGTTWTAGGTLPSSQPWNNIAGGTIGATNYWIAISSSYAQGLNTAIAAYSTNNGTSWSSIVLPSTQYWSNIAYGNSKFVITVGGNFKSGSFSGNGSTAVAAYSTNGTSFTSVSLPSAQGWVGVTYYSGNFVAISGNNTAISADGITWTTPTAVGSNGINANTTAIATNGSNAALTTYNGYIYYFLYPGLYIYFSTASAGPTAPVAYGNGTYIIPTSLGYYSSTDCVNWTYTFNPYFSYGVVGGALPASTGVVTWIGYINGFWWWVFGNNSVSFVVKATALTGGTYTYISTGTANYFNSIAWDGTTNYVITTGNLANYPSSGANTASSYAYSTNSGASFTYVASAGLTAQKRTAVIYSSGYFAMVDANGYLYYLAPASFGFAWSSNTTFVAPTTNLLYANNTWFVVNSSGALYYSTTINGTATNYGNICAATPYFIGFSGTYFIIVPNAGATTPTTNFYYSLTGTSGWTAVPVTTPIYGPTSVLFNNGIPFISNNSNNNQNALYYLGANGI